jgi:hypothetical protein
MYVSDGPVTHEAQSVERHTKRVIGKELLFALRRFRLFTEI